MSEWLDKSDRHRSLRPAGSPLTGFFEADTGGTVLNASGIHDDHVSFHLSVWCQWRLGWFGEVFRSASHTSRRFKSRVRAKAESRAEVVKA